MNEKREAIDPYPMFAFSMTASAAADAGAATKAMKDNDCTKCHSFDAGVINACNPPDDDEPPAPPSVTLPFTAD